MFRCRVMSRDTAGRKALPLGRGWDARQHAAEPSSTEGEGRAVGMPGQSLQLLLIPTADAAPGTAAPAG